MRMAVNFKIDENLPHETAQLLRDAGIDALTVSDEVQHKVSEEAILRGLRTRGFVSA